MLAGLAWCCSAVLCWPWFGLAFGCLSCWFGVGCVGRLAVLALGRSAVALLVRGRLVAVWLAVVAAGTGVVLGGLAWCGVACVVSVVVGWWFLVAVVCWCCRRCGACVCVWDCVVLAIPLGLRWIRRRARLQKGGADSQAGEDPNTEEESAGEGLGAGLRAAGKEDAELADCLGRASSVCSSRWLGSRRDRGVLGSCC